MISLRDLPLTLRALFSSFLIVIGIGYLMALSYLFLVDVEPHQQAGEGVVQYQRKISCQPRKQGICASLEQKVRSLRRRSSTG